MARPARGAATHLEFCLVPPCGRQRRIQWIVVTRQDDRAAIPQQRLDQCLVVAVAQLVLITSGLARSSDVGRVAVREPVRAVEPLEAVSPVAAFDLDTLHPIVDERQILKTGTPAPGRRRGDARSPGVAEQPAETLLNHDVPPHRLLDRVVDRGPRAQKLLVQLARIRQLPNACHEWPEVIAGRDHPEEVDDSPVHIVVNLDLRGRFREQDRRAAAERFDVESMRRQGCEERFFDSRAAFPSKPGKRGTNFADCHVFILIFQVLTIKKGPVIGANRLNVVPYTRPQRAVKRFW